MNILERIRRFAAEKKKNIVLPEGDEDRMIKAAERLMQESICQVTLLGLEHVIFEKAEAMNVSLEGIRIVNLQESKALEKYAKSFFEIRKHKGITEQGAKSSVSRPLFFGAMMVREGEVDGSVAGAVNTTADVLRAGIQCIGLAEGMSVVSSTFLMIVPGWERPFTFADAGVVPDPNPNQLASIAISSAKTHKKLTQDEPIVAMLSFSTYGSADHLMVDKVKEATRLVKEMAPCLKVDGELQVDTAIVPSIAEKKAPGSPVAGKANVLIFPDINSGNIGYKLTQWLANAQALGPLIQGLRKPAMDLSRGCSVEDIVNVSAICCLLGE